jgi:hypothetical protein
LTILVNHNRLCLKNRSVLWEPGDQEILLMNGSDTPACDSQLQSRHALCAAFGDMVVIEMLLRRRYKPCAAPCQIVVVGIRPADVLRAGAIGLDRKIAVAFGTVRHVAGQCSGFAHDDRPRRCLDDVPAMVSLVT